MFKGLGSIGNIAGMMGSLQELPAKLQELNERMQTTTVTGSSRCQSATVEMNATGRVLNVTIQGELTGASLEQAIQDATNQAGTEAKSTYANAIRDMASEMNLNVPGIDSMLSSLTGNG